MFKVCLRVVDGLVSWVCGLLYMFVALRLLMLALCLVFGLRLSFCFCVVDLGFWCLLCLLAFLRVFDVVMVVSFALGCRVALGDMMGFDFVMLGRSGF